MKSLFTVIFGIFSLYACREMKDKNETKETETAAASEASAEVSTPSEVDETANENDYDRLLKKYVSKSGEVDYGGFLKERAALEGYIKNMSAEGPKGSWSKDKEMAYWINMYNANTIKLIIDHSDENIKSIKDIGPKNQIPFVNTPWDIKFITIDGDKMDLNKIEHGILRKKFKEDPRFHFALVCASQSCPKLRNEAYVGRKLDKQLDDQAREFLNDESRNKISDKEVKISMIFKWFEKDFERKDKIAEWVNKYSEDKIDEKTKKFDYLDYSWKLNGSF